MSCARSSRTKIKVFKDKRNTLLDEENDISQTSEGNCEKISYYGLN